MFTFLLRVSPHALPPGNQKAPSPGGAVAAALGPLSEASGGKLHVIVSMKHLLGTMESVGQRVVNLVGPSVLFEPLRFYPDKFPIPVANPPASVRKVLHPTRSPGSWPLPDDMTLASFVAAGSLSSSATISHPLRNGHPTIRFNPSPIVVPNHPGDFTVDKYLVEPSAMSDWMASLCSSLSQGEPGLSYIQSLPGATHLTNRDHLCFECYIQPYGDSGYHHGAPSGVFGFLKPQYDTNPNPNPSAPNPAPAHSLYLWVLPYNYPSLFTLLNTWNQSGTPKWRDDWSRYLRSVPGYYMPYLQAGSFPFSFYSLFSLAHPSFCCSHCSLETWAHDGHKLCGSSTHATIVGRGCDAAAGSLCAQPKCLPFQSHQINYSCTQVGI